MSAYSTKTITKEEAINLIVACKLEDKREKYRNKFQNYSLEELGKILHEYVYSEEYWKMDGGPLELLINYDIVLDKNSFYKS